MNTYHNPPICILTRVTAGRKELFKRYAESVKSQTYDNVKVFFTEETDEALEVIREHFKDELIIPVDKPDNPTPGWYNLHCNVLIKQCRHWFPNGWYLFCDDDDFITHPNAIYELAQHINTLPEPMPIIMRMLRKGKIKPPWGAEQMIPPLFQKGRIGGSCIAMPCSLPVPLWKAKMAADWDWLSEIKTIYPLSWSKVVVVESPVAMLGKES